MLPGGSSVTSPRAQGGCEGPSGSPQAGPVPSRVHLLQAQAGKFPLLQSVPVPLPSPAARRPRRSAISGSTLSRGPRAAGRML